MRLSPLNRRNVFFKTFIKINYDLLPIKEASWCFLTHKTVWSNLFYLLCDVALKFLQPLTMPPFTPTYLLQCDKVESLLPYYNPKMPENDQLSLSTKIYWKFPIYLYVPIQENKVT